MRNYVVVDLETTGLSRYKHGITEVAAVRFDGTKSLESFHSLVNPQRHIPIWIERLTWISNEMVEDAPIIKDVFSGFLEFLWDDVLVAHNASFDMWFLGYYYLQSFDKAMDCDVLCTRKLANRILPELPSKSLGSLCAHFSLTNKQAHRAMADVEVTVNILQYFLDLLAEKWVLNVDDVLDFQSQSVSSCGFK